MTAAEMQDLVATLERQFGDAWVLVIDWLRQQNDVDAIADRLRAGDVEGVIRGIDEAGAKFAAHVTDGYHYAGRVAASWLDGVTPASTLISFDATNTRAVQWAQRNRAEIVRGLEHDQRGVITRVISEGVRDGDSPIETARSLRDAIGLTDYQEQIVSRYRDVLDAGDYSAALQRELSDGRYDRSLESAIRDRRVIPADQQQRMVEAYRRNMVTTRAETIARTESLRTAHQGSDELFRQAIDRRQISRDDLVREWHTGPKTKNGPRPSHEAMRGQQRRVGETFESGEGNQLAYPCDPNAPPDDTINCRCVVVTRYAA